MGEENNFYYNKELGRWAVRGEEDKIAGTTNTAPPPPKIPESGQSYSLTYIIFCM